MKDQSRLLSRFEEALATLEGHPPESPLPGRNPNAFRELVPELERHSEAGEPRCQAALATILAFGLACVTDSEFREQYDSLIRRATSLWVDAAMQRFWLAFDNLATCGVGPEADAARSIVRSLEQENPALVGSQDGLPVYGPEFMQEACARFARTRAA
jgi:hypothetical protein